MPIRLFFVAIIMVLLVTFIGFNIENRCNVSLAFYTFSEVPVIVTILASFSLGLVAALPFALRGRRDKKPSGGGRGKKGAKAGDPVRDERFPNGDTGAS